MADGHSGRELRKRPGRLRPPQEQAEGSGQAAIRRQRQLFEQELRSYSGEDPLDVWNRYLAWVLHTYPKGGKDSQLYELLQRAVLQFSNERRYHDDARYVNLWIQLAQNSTVPVETFGDMQAEGVGLTHATLYVAWAAEFEKRGDFQKAEAILQEGLQRGAQPVDDLQRCHLALQAAQGVPAEDDPTSPLRTSMVNLRPRGRRKTSNAANKTLGRSHSRGMSLESVSVPVLYEDQAGASVPPSDAKVESTGGGDHQLQLGAEHNQPQEEVGGAKEQSMYCKDQVTNGVIEYSFEELRAERFFLRQREAYDDKNRHLAEVKERLRKELEDKQKLLLLRQNQPSQDGPTAAMEPEVPPKRAKMFQIFEEPQPESASSLSPGNPPLLQNEPCDDVFLRQGEKGLSLRIVYPRVSGCSLPISGQSLTPQTLPEGSASLGEEAIVCSHQNKTLCSSPDDTRAFAGAAKMASTPCLGLLGRRPASSEEGGLTEDLRALTKTAFAASQHRQSRKKLSPIEEGSREAGSFMASASLSSQERLSGGKEGHLSPLEESHQGPDMMDTTQDEAPRADPCSVEVRRRLLEQVDVSGFPNFHPQATPVPAVEENAVLLLGDQIFHVGPKVADGENFSIYTGSNQEGNVVMKVEFSTLPWDFYINRQLGERLAGDHQASTHPSTSCYAFSDGCVTVYHVSGCPRVIKVVHELSLASSAVQLLELVRSLHSCGLLLGAPPTHTLLHYYTNRASRETESVLAVDLSSAVDLQLQTDVTTAQQLPSVSPFISQGVLEPSASPYQVDLLFVAETVHTLLTQRSMSLLKDDSGWMVEEFSDAKPSGWKRQLWGKFFRSILNSSDKPSVSVLSELRDMLSVYAA